MGDDTSKGLIVERNNSTGVGKKQKKKKNKRSSDSSAVAAFGSHHISLSVRVCLPMKESPACVWSRRQKGILRLTALERGRQAFISPNYDMIAENERQGSMWQTKGAGVCPEEKMANHSVMFFGDVSFTF